MRRFAFFAALAALVLPAAAQAKEAPAVAPLADLAAGLRDSQSQRETALMLRAMTEVVLDLPIAPLAEIVAEAAGEPAPAIDPDLTLRKMAPGSSRIGEQIERHLPRAMATLGSLAEALAALAPSVAGMAGQMNESSPQSD